MSSLIVESIVFIYTTTYMYQLKK